MVDVSPNAMMTPKRTADTTTGSSIRLPACRSDRCSFRQVVCRVCDQLLVAFESLSYLYLDAEIPSDLDGEIVDLPVCRNGGHAGAFRRYNQRACGNAHRLLQA